MSSLWEQRAARNEAFFREVNKNIVGLDEQAGRSPDDFLVVCECARDDCMERISLDPDAYARVREHPRRFIVRPEHQDPNIERVIERNEGYFVVEKTGAAGEVAEQAQR